MFRTAINDGISDAIKQSAMKNSQLRSAVLAPETAPPEANHETSGLPRTANAKRLLLRLFFCLISLPLASVQAAEAEEGQTVMEIILGGGPLLVLIWMAIFATSIVMVALVVQNLLTLRRDKVAPPPLVFSIREAITNGNYQEAWQICQSNNNYLANVMGGALERIGRGKEATYDAVIDHGLREAQLIRTRNSYLSVIGVVSPMLGLLGTVIGMIGAFSTLGDYGISDPRALSTSIAEVLFATAGGLFIAIPAFIFYYVFRNSAQIAIVFADDKINSLLVDLPYEELEGVRIGEQFSVSNREIGTEGMMARSVSLSMTTNCPVCSGDIEPGVNPCPHCGATLSWKD